LVFRLVGAASLLVSPFGTAADFRPGVGAGLVVSLSPLVFSNANVGAAARLGRRLSDPFSVSWPSSPSSPLTISTVNALDFGFAPFGAALLPFLLPCFLIFSLRFELCLTR
jgi:hypothetical protein